MTTDSGREAWPIDPSHTRCLDLALSAESDTAIAFRADLLDLRKAGLMALGGRVATAGIIHNMTLHGAFDAQTGEIQRLSWEQSHVMHEANEASRGECCRDPMERLSGLVGSKLGGGFRADLKQHFGGPLGCTHVNTLFQELSATVARLFRQRELDPALGGGRASGERIARRSIYFDAFLPETGTEAELRVRLSDAQYGIADVNGGESMAHHAEVRAAARVDLTGWELRGLRAEERNRRGPAIDTGTWLDRSDDVAVFVGHSLGGGMGKRCSEHFAETSADACLLSAMLAFAPGMTQVGAGLSDTLLPPAAARPERSGAPLGGAGPCYMLRGDGPLLQVITGTAGDD